MRILLTNDDGYQAQGLNILARELRGAKHAVTIIAPVQEQSGKSHSRTFFAPLLARKISSDVYAVAGTPADCVALGVQKMFEQTPPELVISGINSGLNIGMDVNYSGTVGAATEASLLDIPSLAVSMDIDASLSHNTLEEYFTRVAKLVLQIIDLKNTFIWPTTEVLNLNHPGCEPKGIVFAECSRMSIYKPKFQRMIDPESPDSPQEIYYLSGAKIKPNAAANEDVILLGEGFATLSFLQSRQASINTAQTNFQQMVAKLKP